MNIGEASRQSGLPAKTIRYYEDVGLVRPERSDNGYRNYAENDVRRLRFLRRSRALGFSIQEARSFLALCDAQDREGSELRRIAQRRMAEIDRKIADLTSLKQTLADLSEGRPDDGAEADGPLLGAFGGQVRQPAAIENERAAAARQG